MIRPARALFPLALLVLLAQAASAQPRDAFPRERIDRTRAFFQQNAAATGPAHMDCITTLNHAARLLFDDPLLTLGSQIDRTMAALQGVGLAGAPRIIEFNDERGKLTYGVTAPATLRESVWDTVIGMTRGARGWNVFGLSLMDGYHSVTLNVDTSDPANPTIYWSDQWSSNGGFRAHTKETLDEEVRRLTCNWWNPVKKFRTRTTLWRLTPTDSSRVATILSPQLNVRGGASTTAPIVERARKNQKFRVLAQKGLWYEVERADGSRGFVHSAYVRTSRERAPVSAVTASLAPNPNDPPAASPTAPEPAVVASTGLTGAIPQ